MGRLPKVAEHLGWLLKTPDEQLFLSREANSLSIWKKIGRGDLKSKQLCIAPAYLASYVWSHRPCQPDVLRLQRALLQQMQDTMVLFKEQHDLFVQQGVSLEFKKEIGSFAAELGEWGRGICEIMDRASRTVSMGTASWVLPSPPEPQTESERLMDTMLSLQAKAEKIAQLLSTDRASPCSWSVVSENQSRHSMGSGRSMGSERSCLSGHGGPHCFLPSHLFKLADGSGTLISAKDLTNGSKIIAADHAQIEVVRVEVQKTSRMLELEIDDAEPFITTPNHRILVPSTSVDATMMATELRLGSWVICSDDVAKKVVGIRQTPVSEQDVYAITFNPDKAVACFLLPENPVVLSKGLTRKPSRRGGMNRRVRRRVGEDELASIPDTAPGEYED